MFNPTNYYLELVNALQTDVSNDRYDALYALRCGNLVLKGFSHSLNEIMENYPDSTSITNVLEIYLTLYDIYNFYSKDNESLPDDLDFPVIPKGWIISELSYSKGLKLWYIIVTNSEKEYNIFVEKVDYYSALIEVEKRISDWKIGKEIHKLKLESRNDR